MKDKLPKKKRTKQQKLRDLDNVTAVLGAILILIILIASARSLYMNWSQL